MQLPFGVVAKLQKKNYGNKCRHDISESTNPCE